MSNSSAIGRRLILTCWMALLGWQIVWHGLAPPPLGNRSWLLVLLASTPLVLLTRGIWQASQRSYFWAMLLMMLYFLIGVTETWSNADQRLAAVAQTVLTLGFFGGLILSNRPVK